MDVGVKGIYKGNKGCYKGSFEGGFGDLGFLGLGVLGFTCNRKDLPFLGFLIMVSI